MLRSSQKLEKQIISKNTIYKVVDSFDLKGESIHVPENSTLFFEGGCFKNGIIYLDRSSQLDGRIVFVDIELLPSFKMDIDNKSKLTEVKADWFGVVGDSRTDDSHNMLLALKSAQNMSVPLRISRGYYKMTKPLVLKKGDIVLGDSPSIVNANNQLGMTILRFYGNMETMVRVEGGFVQLKDLSLVVNKPYSMNGVYVKGSLHSLRFENVSIGNSRYGIYSVLGEGEGLTMTVFDNVRIENCVRAISIDMDSHNKGQFITHNYFRNLYICGVKEKGVYLHARGINSTHFEDCNFEHVGYGKYNDSSYTNASVYSIEINNESRQGNVTISKGYYENLYYSKDGKLIDGYNYQNNSVIAVRNMSVSVSDVRFVNTKTIVKSMGNDMIYISNCIDNGFLFRGKDAWICLENIETSLVIEGYCFDNSDKKIISSPLSKPQMARLRVENIRLSSGKFLNDIVYTR